MAFVVLAGCAAAAQAGPGQAMEATGTSRSSSSSRSNNTGAAIDAAQKALSDYLRSSDQQDGALLDQDAQDRLRQQYEEAQRAAAQARAKQQEADYERNRDRIKERYGADPALNPWGNGSASRDKPRNAPADAPDPSAAAKAGAKDPGLDYAGQACEYFTRPSDAAHLNYYSEGSTVAYGGRVYQCKDGRWAFRYPDTVLSARDRSRLSATQQEK
ncbi:hypothetical protein LMG26858_01058 [Achromobacter anxifer]|uniref:Uncharacterized protein n=2 Tax=Achromobacter anxifer TaxID=1287737 RepID=A0A6S7CI31_9BURK|nr:hypothetical protein LMG26858_01058 [Achromobacter anxifer]